MRRAIITGITGQDGSYLAELLLAKGYEVHGLVRRVALEDPEHRMQRLVPMLDRLHLHAASLDSFASVARVLTAVAPDECYHLAAQSFVSHAIEEEPTTLTQDITSTYNLLGALHAHAPSCRFYFAGSSEMFGRAPHAPQNEATPFQPRSAYGISKVAGAHLVRKFRDEHHLHASIGITYNHESPRRGREFVTRKITSQAVRIKRGLAQQLTLGNLEAVRDWGHAADYVRAMWTMLQQDTPDDYVIATGQTHSVADFAAAAFAEVELDWRAHVVTDPRFFRATEAVPLVGDATKARTTLGWSPTYTFAEIVREMVASELREGRAAAALASELV